MRVLISGISGFVGSKLAEWLVQQPQVKSVSGIDNLSRRGSWLHLERLKQLGVEAHHGDVRNPSDLETLPRADWLIDAAASPSVLGGLNSTSSRQLVETNLNGTTNLLEYCKKHACGMILLSTSRVYSIAGLASLGMRQDETRFAFDDQNDDTGVSDEGIGEGFSTAAPISLYGATKLASEALALEYSHAFEFPVWINRCGVLAGAGQLGKADQGIFSFWLHSWAEKSALKYIGFGGTGRQVRDCLHPSDLARLVALQMQNTEIPMADRIFNVSGGRDSSSSLKELSNWCTDRWGDHRVESSDENRPYDLPWVVLNSQRARDFWNWKPEVPLPRILQEIAEHADSNPQWLSLCE